MPAVGYDFNFLRCLSDFWNRFFADANQLHSLYEGSALLIGQAYLDYLSTVLGVSLRDAVALDRELFQMLTIREDQVAFVEGDTSPDNRWAFALPSPVVSFASIDNQVVEPTASLEPNLDFEVANGVVLFHVDPTNPTGNGTPLNGYARRAVDVAVGGQWTDSTVTTWVTTPVAKGDTIRQLAVGTDGSQRKVADYAIVLVRAPALFVSENTPLPQPASSVTYVILRVPSDAQVSAESFTVSGGTATLSHTRIDQGSLRIFAHGPTGADVVEGVDYTVNYESGTIIVLTAWQLLPGPYGADYTWREEIFPTSGVSPRLETTGTIVATVPMTTSVLEIAAWAPDTMVDRMTLANNFGSFIGRMEPSSEAYRAFLQGIFQLYILGPVLERIESALNVVLNLPVVHNDGETYQSTNTSDPTVDRIFTTSPTSGQTVTYEFPKGTPLRTDLVVGQVLMAFEPLTTAVTVTDYVQTPSWWYGQVIPRQLFSGSTVTTTESLSIVLGVIQVSNTPVLSGSLSIVADGPTNAPVVENVDYSVNYAAGTITVLTAWQGAPGPYLVEYSWTTVPSISRRTASAEFVAHIVNPSDGALVGDPGLVVGADENGFIPTARAGLPPLRHRLAFVLMDRYLKFHTFSVTFNATALSVVVGTAFAQSLEDLNNLVLSARPAHTYAFTTPSTAFSDEVEVDEDTLGVAGTVGSRTFGPDEVIFTDTGLIVGVNGWMVGDYFHYELNTASLSFPSIGTPVSLPDAPSAPRRRRLVRVFANGTIGGLRLVENVDYSVDYVNCTVTRLSAWDATTINVTFRQLNIGNLANASQPNGDMQLMVDNIDPALITAAFNPSAAGWDGVITPPTAPRDIGMVESAIVLTTS